MWVMCELLDVSRSGYYAWRHRPPSRRDQEDAELTREIRDIYTVSRKTYGSPRIHAELQARGYQCGRKRVARLMRAADLQGCPLPSRPRTTQAAPEAAQVPDLLNRDFSAPAPNQKWVADITYIWTAEGWLYLAVVLDLYSRMVIGWGMSSRMTADLVCLALLMALQWRVPCRELIHHSDRGGQYISQALQDLFTQHHIRPSIGSRGDCYDNAAMESFFATLKRECVHRQTFLTRDAARLAIFDYIETFYNRVRRHSTLDYYSPYDFEQRYYQTLSQSQSPPP